MSNFARFFQVSGLAVMLHGVLESLSGAKSLPLMMPVHLRPTGLSALTTGRCVLADRLVTHARFGGG